MSARGKPTRTFVESRLDFLSENSRRRAGIRQVDPIIAVSQPEYNYEEMESGVTDCGGEESFSSELDACVEDVDNIRMLDLSNSDNVQGRKAKSQNSTINRYEFFRSGFAKHVEEFDPSADVCYGLDAVSLVDKLKKAAVKVSESAAVRQASQAACSVGSRVRDFALPEDRGYSAKSDDGAGGVDFTVPIEAQGNAVAYRVARLVELVNTLTDDNVRQAHEIRRLKVQAIDLANDVEGLESVEKNKEEYT